MDEKNKVVGAKLVCHSSGKIVAKKQLAGANYLYFVTVIIYEMNISIF